MNEEVTNEDEQADSKQILKAKRRKEGFDFLGYGAVWLGLPILFFFDILPKHWPSWLLGLVFWGGSVLGVISIAIGLWQFSATRWLVKASLWITGIAIAYAVLINIGEQIRSNTSSAIIVGAIIIAWAIYASRKH